MEQGTGQGVAFPAVDGRRSSQATARAVVAAAAAAVDPALAAAVESEPDWRHAYVGHLRRLTVAAARSEAAAASVATAGLDAVHGRFTFRRGDDELPLDAALGLDAAAPRLVPVAGTAPHPASLGLPHGDAVLTGAALRRRLDAWTDAGVLEPSCAQAVRLVADNPDWLDLSDLTFVLLGAAAEVGPLLPLCRWGARVVALDVRDAAVTSRIVSAARQGSGRLLLPARERVDDDADLVGAAGIDLLTELPEARRLLDQVEGPLVVGNYAYADGAAFARLAAGVDALVADLQRSRPGLAIAHLATPTDAFAVPEECVEAARRRLAEAGALRRGTAAVLRGVSGRRLLVPNYREAVTADDGRILGVADALVVQQGPNYALAKRLQRWRAEVAVLAGVTTSANVAPAAYTRSVLRNRLLAAAYAGARRFGIEVFQPATAATLMAALLVHDLRNPAGSAPGSAASAARPVSDLFARSAAHGGLWRVAWEPRSALGLAAITGIASRRR
ncbi:MAG: hypothetical protein ACJ74O_15575 [Frankiaceae bacterium]